MRHGFLCAVLGTQEYIQRERERDVHINTTSNKMVNTSRLKNSVYVTEVFPDCYVDCYLLDNFI